MKTYEGLFIFPNSLKDEERDQALERIEGELTRVEATILGVQKLGRRGFARPIKKRESGYYVRIVFQANEQALVPLTARFKLHDEIVRVQFLIASDRIVGEVTAPKESESAPEAVTASEESKEVDNG